LTPYVSELTYIKSQTVNVSQSDGLQVRCVSSLFPLSLVIAAKLLWFLLWI